MSATSLGFICSSVAWGGLEMNLYNLALWLKERGHTITFYLLTGSRLDEKAKAAGFTVRYIQKHRKYFDFGKARKLAAMLKEDKVANAFIFHNYDTDVASLAKRFYYPKLKLVYLQQMQLGVAKRDLIHTLRYRMFDAWITPLQFLYDEIGAKTRYPLDRVHIIPLCLEVERFVNNTASQAEARAHFTMQPQGLLMGIIGRLDKLKGQDFLIEATAELNKRGHNVELLIVGEPTLDNTDNYDGYLHSLVQQLGVGEKVHFRPFTSRSELFFRAVDVFAMASAGETFGMVTVEAMLSGTPVVATNTSGTPEVLGNGSLGQLYTPRNVNEFISRIEYILTHKEEIMNTANKACSVASQRYSHRTMCDAIEKMLTRLNQ